MRWSKVKQLVEERMAPSLHGRVEVHYTRYRILQGEYGRGWITVDKREIVDMSDHKFIHQRVDIESKLAAGDLVFDGRYIDVDHRYTAPRSQSILHQQGVYSGWEFKRSLRDSLSLSANAALLSENVVIRALGMLDGRIGKRRLLMMQFRDDEPLLVRQFYDLRCEAEGITKPVAQASA